MLTGNDGAVAAFQGMTPAAALDAYAVDAVPVSGDMLTRLHHDVTGFVLYDVEGQLWR